MQKIFVANTHATQMVTNLGFYVSVVKSLRFELENQPFATTHLLILIFIK